MKRTNLQVFSMKKLFLLLLLVTGALQAATITSYEYEPYEVLNPKGNAVFRGSFSRAAIERLKSGYFLSVVCLQDNLNLMETEIGGAVKMVPSGKSFQGVNLDRGLCLKYTPKSGQVNLKYNNKKETQFNFYFDNLTETAINFAKINLSGRIVSGLSNEFSEKELVFINDDESSGLFGASFPLIERKKTLEFKGVVNGVAIKAKVDRNYNCTLVMKPANGFNVALRKTTINFSDYTLQTHSRGYGDLYATIISNNTYALKAVPYPGSKLSFIWLPDSTRVTNEELTITIDEDDAWATAFFSRFTLKVTVNDEEAGTVDVLPDEYIYTITAIPNEGYKFLYFLNQRGEIIFSNPYYTFLDSNMELEAVFEKKF